MDTLPRVGDSALVCKVLYKKLLSVESSPPILHRQWSQVIGPGFSLDGHWSLVRDSFTENFENDVIWLIILRGVKGGLVVINRASHLYDPGSTLATGRL